MARELTHFIGGKAVPGKSGRFSDVFDPNTGAIANEQITLQQDDAGLQTQIVSTEASINAMQQTLFQQLAQADTLISTLDTQQSLLTASIQSLDYTLYGAQTTSGTPSTSTSG